MVLKRLADPEVSLEQEANLETKIYSQIGRCNNVDVKEFINQLSADIGKIYEKVKKKKLGKELEFIELEKAFGHFRLSLDKNGIQNLWENVLTSLGAFENRKSIPQGPSNEAHLILLQHVLQHCWTILAKGISFQEAFVSANSTSDSAESQNASESLSDNV